MENYERGVNKEMRAVLVREFGEPEQLVVEELDAHDPGPGQVVISVKAASVNYPDLLVIDGSYQNLPDRPFSPGKEAAGVISKVGSGVNRVKPGDRVMTLVEYGAYASELLVSDELVIPIPDSMEFNDAAAFGLVYSTAWFGLVRRAALSPGETVLVTGAGGGVGSASVQLAKAYGATVIALARDEERARLALEQGADHAITSTPASLKSDLMELTGKRGVDVTIENLGGDYLSQIIRSTAWEGRIVLVGFASGSQNPIKPGHLLVKNIGVVGLQSSDYRDRDPALMRSSMKEMLGLFTEGKLDPQVDKIFSLDEASDAVRYVKSGGVRGKVVIGIDS